MTEIFAGRPYKNYVHIIKATQKKELLTRIIIIHFACVPCDHHENDADETSLFSAAISGCLLLTIKLGSGQSYHCATVDIIVVSNVPS